MTTTDSNAGGHHPGGTYTFTPMADGTTRIDATVVREGKNLKGRFFGILFRLVGQEVLGGPFEKTVDAIEARSDKQSPPTAGPNEHRARQAKPAAPGDISLGWRHGRPSAGPPRAP